jgi:hypothetical protein
MGWHIQIESVVALSLAAVVLAVLLALSAGICLALGVRTYWILVALCAVVFLLIGIALFYAAGRMSAAV